MKPANLPNASQKARDVLAELELEFPEVGAPENVELPDLLELPVGVSSLEAPILPDLTLPEQAMSEIEIPAAMLPMEVFDLG